MHPTQLEIINSLRQGESRKFNELLSDVAETSDNLTYHLKRLIGAGLIMSTSKGEYSLAKKGLIYLNNNLELNHDLFPTVSCMLELYDKNSEILVMRKLKQPYLGSKHLPTFGITSDQTLEKQINQFLERYDIKSEKILFKCNYRERVRSISGVYIFDKLFVVFEGRLNSFTQKIDDREFLTQSIDQLMNGTDVLPGTKTVLKQKTGAGFIEVTNNEAESIS